MMSHVARMQLAGRITYYVGVLALVCGGLVHLNIARLYFFSLPSQKPIYGSIEFLADCQKDRCAWFFFSAF